MPWSLNHLTEAVQKLQNAVPLTFNWYTGRTQPLCEQEQIVFWEDVDADIAKILMRRGGKTYIFTSYLATPGGGPTITVSAHAHRHASSGSSLVDVGADPIAPYNFAWTGIHTFTPSSNGIPITINKGSSVTSADLFQINDDDSTELFVVDNIGLVGINTDPDSMLTIEGIVGLEPPIASPLAWFLADDITGLSTGSNVTTWPDRSGNGYDLTGAGITSGGGASATRPKWYAAGNSYATTNLSCVNFESDSGTGNLGYFTIGGAGTIPLTIASGWTIGFIYRDHTSVAQTNFLFGVAPADLNDNYIAIIGNGAPNLTQAYTEEGATVKYFSNSTAHSDGADTEAWVVRCTASAGVLRSWLDGTLMTSTANGGGPFTRVSDVFFRYIGAYGVGGPSWTSVYGKSIAEIIIYDRALSDSEVATLNTYLLTRIAGSLPVTTNAYDFMRLKDNLGTVITRFDDNGFLGIGTDPSYAVDVLDNATQVRIGYDSSNYMTVAVSSAGAVTFNAVGASAGFTFVDQVTFNPTTVTTPAVDIKVGTRSTNNLPFRVRNAADTATLCGADSNGFLLIGEEALGTWPTGYNLPPANSGVLFTKFDGSAAYDLWWGDGNGAYGQLTQFGSIYLDPTIPRVWYGDQTFEGGIFVSTGAEFATDITTNALTPTVGVNMTGPIRGSNIILSTTDNAATIAFKLKDITPRTAGPHAQTAWAFATSDSIGNDTFIFRQTITGETCFGWGNSVSPIAPLAGRILGFLADDSVHHASATSLLYQGILSYITHKDTVITPPQIIGVQGYASLFGSGATIPSQTIAAEGLVGNVSCLDDTTSWSAKKVAGARFAFKSTDYNMVNVDDARNADAVYGNHLLATLGFYDAGGYMFVKGGKASPTNKPVTVPSIRVPIQGFGSGTQAGILGVNRILGRSTATSHQGEDVNNCTTSFFMSVPFPPVNIAATSGTANAAVSSTNTTLTDTRLAMTTNQYIGTVITCNGKTMTVTSNTGTVFTGASWSGGGNPGNGNAWSLVGTLRATNAANLAIQAYAAPAGGPTWATWNNPEDSETNSYYGLYLDKGTNNTFGLYLHNGSSWLRLVTASSAATYTPTNVTTDRSYDANATSIDELADVLGTLIADLQTAGLLA